MHNVNPLGKITNAVWQHRLGKDVYLQLRNGIRVESLPRDDLTSAEADEAFAARQLERLKTIEKSSLNADELLTVEFLEHRLGWQSRSTDFWWSTFPVTPYNVMWLSLYLQLIFKPYRFERPEDGERYLALLADYAALVRDMNHRLAEQGKRGWAIPRPALPTVRSTLGGLTQAVRRSLPVEQTRLAALGAGAASVEARIRDFVGDEISPALAALQEAVGTQYEQRASASVGLAQFPAGAEAYERLIRYHTTLDLDAQGIHDLGLEQVREITAAMTEVRSSLGFDASEADFHHHLKASGRLYAASAAGVETRYQQCIEKIEPLIADYFELSPHAAYGIERLDPAAEAGMSYGYYQPPTDDNPTGLYRYNGAGLETRSQLGAAALIYHELLPGHHFHLARQKENESLPMIRREAIDITVFNEGWAEYASALAGEMGLYGDPYDRYGRLVHERFTAQRLVVDTGMNALGWSLEEARDYMRRHTLESDTQVASETLRYSTDMPAQALAYRIGYLKILSLRERVRATQGRHFDIRAFHEWILGPGALPLPVLERHLNRRMNEWPR